MHPLFSTTLLAALCIAGCAGSDAARETGCAEDPRALVQEPSAMVESGSGARLEVEVAREPDELSRGLQYRRCDVDGLLLINDEPGTLLPIWMCRVVAPLDLAFLREGQVVHVVEAAPPCDGPCGSCAVYGAGIAVDAVLETPAGRFSLEVGEHISVQPLGEG